MANPTEHYVDPAIAADSGAGTIGDPYGDLQYALNRQGIDYTRDATNGDRFNVKTGTDEILSAALSVATYGTPSNNAPLVIQGYTSAAGDGGIGGISGNGSVAVFNSSTLDGIVLKDMHLHNCGAATVVTLDDWIVIDNCEIDNTTGSGIIIDDNGTITNCHIHNCGTRGIDCDVGCHVEGNYLQNGTNDFTIAITTTFETNCSIYRNIISIDGATTGIEFGNGTIVAHNSILHTAGSGTGKGILVNSSAGTFQRGVHSNIVEGFGGAGGVGIDTSPNTAWNYPIVARNAVFDCTTAYSNADHIVVADDNETLSATGFAKSGADTFANRHEYFAPAASGNVLGGAFAGGSTLDKGAVQSSGTGGGSTRFFSATFEEVSVGAAQDLFEFSVPADKIMVIHHVAITQSSDAGNAESEQIRLKIKRVTGAPTPGSGGTSANPAGVTGPGTSDVSVSVNHTTRLTGGTATTIYLEDVNIMGGFHYLPTPDDRPVFSPSEYCVIGIEAAPATALTMSGTVVYEELGG